MKKNYTLILLFICAALFTSAQCIPDTSITHNIPGIYPDSATGLPHAYVGIPYSADIQIRVLTDTTYLGFPAIVDSIAIMSVTGMPTGFAYTCTPPSCVFPGGSNACIYLYGPPPTTGMVGTFPIVVNMNIYGRAFGIPQTIQSSNTSYSITIETNVGVQNVNAYSFTVGQNAPNPANGFTNIPVNLPKNSTVHFTLANLLGKQVLNSDFNLSKGSNFIPVNLLGMPQGIYLYTVSFGNNTFTKRMVVSGN